MAANISVTDLARNLADFINRVAYKGESFVLRRGNRALAELKPVALGRQLKDLPGVLRALPRLSKKDADDFSTDLEKAREALRHEKVRDPWDS